MLLRDRGAPRRKKILAISSGGGHWVELLRLRPAFEGHFVVYVTVDSSYQCQIDKAPLRVIQDATRWSQWRMSKTIWQVFRILVEERPDIVVSTGALPGFFGIWLAKRLGIRTIWIDSLANAEELSMSGQRIGPHADLWLTQWPELARPRGPHFAGTVLE